jgi:Family of unknown function (DUF6533)
MIGSSNTHLLFCGTSLALKVISLLIHASICLALLTFAKYCGCAAFTILLYDHMISFADEVEPVSPVATLSH